MSPSMEKCKRAILFLPAVACALLTCAVKCRAGVAEEVLSTRAFGTVSAIAFSPGGTLLAVAGADRTVHLLKPDDGSEIRSIEVPNGTVYALAFSANGKLLVTGQLKELAVWKSETGDLVHRIENRTGRVAALSFSPDGRFMAAAGSGSSVHLFETETWHQSGELKTRGLPAEAIAFAPDGKTVVGASGSRILLWDVQEPLPKSRIAAHRGKTVSCLFGTDPGTVISAGDNRLIFWNTAEGSAIKELNDHGGRLVALAVSGDRRLLVSAANNKTIFIRHPAEGQALYRIRNSQRAVECLALGPRADYLACGMRSPGTTFILWKLDPEGLHAGEGILAGDEIEADYLSKLERDVIREHNLARADPPRYAAFLKLHRSRYTGKTLAGPAGRSIATQEGVAAVDEAIGELEKLRPMPPLAPSQGMSLASRDHAADIGQRGIMGHTGTDGSTPSDRMNRHGQWQGGCGENIAGGIADARSIVLQLIIDDGVPGRGHRRNIFNPQYRVTGVHFGSHGRLGSICVITYANGYTEKRR